MKNSIAISWVGPRSSLSRLVRSFALGNAIDLNAASKAILDMPINILSGTVVKEIIDRRYPSDYRSVEGPILTWNELSKYKLAYNGGMLDVR